MIQIILSILILLTSFPAGYLLAYLTRDELVAGRKWFFVLGVVGVVWALGVGFLSVDFVLKLSIILGLFYISIVSLVCVYLSYEKKFVK